MSVVADSSAVVKLYVEEKGSSLVASSEPLTVSALARVEVAAAVMRKVRVGALAGDLADVLVDELEADLTGLDGAPRCATVRVDVRLLERATELVRSHPLKGYDAVQLATALAVRDVDPEPVTFLCFDAQLGRAARAEGLAVAPDPG